MERQNEMAGGEPFDELRTVAVTAASAAARVTETSQPGQQDKKLRSAVRDRWVKVSRDQVSTSGWPGSGQNAMLWHVVACGHGRAVTRGRE